MHEKNDYLVCNNFSTFANVLNISSPNWPENHITIYNSDNIFVGHSMCDQRSYRINVLMEVFIESTPKGG